MTNKDKRKSGNGKRPETSTPVPLMRHVVVPALVLALSVCVVAWTSQQQHSAPQRESADRTREERAAIERAAASARTDVSDATLTTAPAEEERRGEPSSQAQDSDPNCAAWAKMGECEKNEGYMLSHCTASCSAAAEPAGLPSGWKEYVDPQSGRPYYSDGTTTQWERPASAQALSKELPSGWREYKDPTSGRSYYSDGVTSQWEVPTAKGASSTPAAAASGGDGEVDVWKSVDECIAWAGAGECEKNAAFMKVNCAVSCGKVIAARDAYAARCKRPEGSTAALAPNMMNATFERILREFGHLEPEMMSHDPPLVLFHKFLSGDEADVFIKHGKGRYTESRGVGVDKDGRMTDVKTEIRTSSHTWCQEPPCVTDPTVRRVVERVSDVSMTPATNGEFAQLVYYRSCPKDDDPSCAFYKRHSDYIEGDLYRVQGPRIYTLFMYLNDVPEGGGTRFTDLPSGSITFSPSRGKAILWPSVLEGDPFSIDPRTHHEALPVTKGEKFGANFWIHQYDFVTPHQQGCTYG